MTGGGDGGQPADDTLDVASSPAVTDEAPAVRPSRRQRRHERRLRRWQASVHPHERFGALRRIRSGFALILVIAITGAALAALLVAVVALIVIGLRHAGS